MSLIEKSLNTAAKYIPADEYLSLRARQDISPEEREQLTTGASSIGIDLNNKPKPTVNPTILFSRTVVKNIPLESYIHSRIEVTERAIDLNHRRGVFYEIGLHQDSEEQDKAFFREKTLEKDLEITQSVAAASQVEF